MTNGHRKMNLEPASRPDSPNGAAGTILRNLSVATGFTFRYIACDESGQPVPRTSFGVGDGPALSGLLPARPRGRFAGLAPGREPGGCRNRRLGPAETAGECRRRHGLAGVR